MYETCDPELKVPEHTYQNIWIRKLVSQTDSLVRNAAYKHIFLLSFVWLDYHQGDHVNSMFRLFRGRLDFLTQEVMNIQFSQQEAELKLADTSRVSSRGDRRRGSQENALRCVLIYSYYQTHKPSDRPYPKRPSFMRGTLKV